MRPSVHSSLIGARPLSSLNWVQLDKLEHSPLGLTVRYVVPSHTRHQMYESVHYPVINIESRTLLRQVSVSIVQINQNTL